MHVSRPTSLRLMIVRFRDAAASIQHTTTEFNYQLVVQRAYEEGEEQFYESDDGDPEDGTFIQSISFWNILTEHRQKPKTREYSSWTSPSIFAAALLLEL